MYNIAGEAVLLPKLETNGSMFLKSSLKKAKKNLFDSSSEWNSWGVTGIEWE